MPCDLHLKYLVLVRVFTYIFNAHSAMVDKLCCDVTTSRLLVSLQVVHQAATPP